MPKNENVPTSNQNYERYSNGISYIRQSDIQLLEGKLLTLIEMLGLNRTQEEAVKSNIRQIAWSVWEEAYSIPEDLKNIMFSGKYDIKQVKYLYMPMPMVDESSAGH